MSEFPPLPLRIGYNRRRVLLSAGSLLLVATVGGLVFAGAQRGRSTILGQVLASRDVGPFPLLFLVVEGVALVVVGVAVGGTLRRRDFIVLREDGVEFHNAYGVFLAEWANVAGIERAPAGYAGIRLYDRSRLVETHQGTAAQRQLLESQEPFGDYDLILQPEELSCGVERFVAWANELRASRTEPDGGV